MNNESRSHQPLLPATVAALGVVFGDIGTSPLYAFRQCFYGEYSIPVTVGNVLGILSLIFWSLMLIISLKYLWFVMRQDKNGEGGIVSLVALLGMKSRGKLKQAVFLIPLGIFGAALLYGDDTITPAISVLSAIEGLGVVNYKMQAWVVPITVFILIALFWLQHRGTQIIGSIFGPIMLLWFISLGALGLHSILEHPEVLRAIDPSFAWLFFQANGFIGFLVLGTVFLVVTGGEALYADMGRFGLRSIRYSWFVLVLPALLLNYFGQGALVLSRPEEITHSFFHLAPEWLQYPLIALATFAAIIASQAVITGTFSLTAQAIRLDFLPRMKVLHTSAEERGKFIFRL
jgi:KUP system potassium uptake protein